MKEFKEKLIAYVFVLIYMVAGFGTADLVALATGAPHFFTIQNTGAIAFAAVVALFHIMFIAEGLDNWASKKKHFEMRFSFWLPLFTAVHTPVFFLPLVLALVYTDRYPMTPASIGGLVIVFAVHRLLEAALVFLGVLADAEHNIASE